MGLWAARSPCGASAFGRFAELSRQAFSFYSPRVFRLAEPSLQNQSWPTGGSYGSIEYGQMSNLLRVNGFGPLETEIIRLRSIPCLQPDPRTDAARALTRRCMSSSGSSCSPGERRKPDRPIAM
jgi:hypothetical protein